MRNKPLHRSQILLEPEQFKKLTSIARKQKRSMSDLTRELVRIGLSQIENQGSRGLDALNRLRQRRLEFYGKRKVYNQNPVDQVRKERSIHLTKLLKDK